MLPGLDAHLDEASWAEITPAHPEHPQFGLKTLLDRLGLERKHVRHPQGHRCEPRASRPRARSSPRRCGLRARPGAGTPTRKPPTAKACARAWPASASSRRPRRRTRRRRSRSSCARRRRRRGARPRSSRPTGCSRAASPCGSKRGASASMIPPGARSPRRCRGRFST